MRPEPMSNQSALVPSLSVMSRSAVVISADWDSAGVQSGWTPLSSARAPAVCGLAIEVPEMKCHSTLLSVPAAARMSTPGAETDGLIEDTDRLGPRLENAAMMSPLASLTSATEPDRAALVPGWAAMNAFSATPSA